MSTKIRIGNKKILSKSHPNITRISRNMTFMSHILKQLFRKFLALSYISEVEQAHKCHSFSNYC